MRPRRLNVVFMIIRESTRLVNDQRQYRDRVVPRRPAFWQVWHCLRDCGWTMVRVGGDPHPRFVRPGCASVYGQEGFEWFGGEEALREHILAQRIDGRERTGELEWWELWDALRDQGWTRHHDWKLLAPGGSVDGREGLHWFATPDDVVAFRRAPPRRQDDDTAARSAAPRPTREEDEVMPDASRPRRDEVPPRAPPPQDDEAAAWRALEALGWREDARGPQGKAAPRYRRPGGLSARGGGVEGVDFFRSRADAIAYAASPQSPRSAASEEDAPRAALVAL